MIFGCCSKDKTNSYTIFQVNIKIRQRKVWETIVFQMAITKVKAKQKCRVMFEIRKSGDKTSSGEIGLDMRQDQVSKGVSVLCCHTASVANVPWEPHTIT